MKKLSLLLSLVLTTSIIYGQDMLLKKQTVVHESRYELYVHYKYDADWKLDSIIHTGQNGDTGVVQVFQNERIFIDDRVNIVYTYAHFEDSSVSFDAGNNNTVIYHFNQDYQVSYQQHFGPTGENWDNPTHTWVNENCTHTMHTSGQEENLVYYENYLNPLFNENKFLKRSFQGSKNFLQLGKFISSSWDQTVVSSLNGYPTEVDVADGNQSRTLIFEYYNFSGIENGIGDGDVRVIDIRYFNLLGQQIEKPIRGFYIESILNEKGVISKKFLIP